MRFIRQSEHIKYNDEYNLINEAFKLAMQNRLFRDEVFAQATPQWNPRLVKTK